MNVGATRDLRADNALILPAWIGLTTIALALSVFMGVVDIPPVDVIAALVGKGSAQARSIIIDIRLPRVLVGMVVGVHFAVAGFILQSITRNPLADPSIMGISQGATLAVGVFLLFSVYIHNPGSNTLAELPLAWLPSIAIIGGLLAGLAIYAMAFGRNLGPIRLTICGVAVGALLHAVAIGLIAGWGSARIEILLEWLSGSLYARSWDHLRYLLPFTVVGLAMLPLIRRPLTMLRFDSSVSRSFGLSHKLHFSLALALACCLAASAVGVAGPIVFVGLIVPHLARFLAGRRFALVLPFTLALGIVVVTLGDLVGRLAGGAEEIPIGVVTAIFGAPLLLVLLRRMA
ncbi:MAG: ferrichrome ABC transporter permease [Rhizobiales bacterium 65-9]|nr:iron ABC transporter permease [Hyphomicrobiales bacterium]OJY36091.1 MAG: ferrichrome ABC transporter permease [Rhizobiales bacterium 65-9]